MLLSDWLIADWSFCWRPFKPVLAGYNHTMLPNVEQQSFWILEITLMFIQVQNRLPDLTDSPLHDLTSSWRPLERN